MLDAHFSNSKIGFFFLWNEPPFNCRSYTASHSPTDYNCICEPLIDQTSRRPYTEIWPYQLKLFWLENLIATDHVLKCTRDRIQLMFYMNKRNGMPFYFKLTCISTAEDMQIWTKKNFKIYNLYLSLLQIVIFRSNLECAYMSKFYYFVIGISFPAYYYDDDVSDKHTIQSWRHSTICGTEIYLNM